ncbi:S8 family peptidase [Ideonella aquatica]|uniref:S8 family peptidase n=1 Tax=Ideonella aquatica TaxID=2824119 RepID=UPI001FFD6009|nr:S8 family peptidase [Ideonella aquatica]
MSSRATPLPRTALVTALAGLILMGALAHGSARAEARGPLREDLSSRQQDLAEATGDDIDADAGQFTDRLIVRYRSGSAGNRRSVLSASQPTHDALHRLGLSVRRTHRGGLGAQVMTLGSWHPVSELRAVAQRLMAEDPSVLYAEPDRRMHTFVTADDPMYLQQWHYFDPKGGINLPAAWQLSDGTGMAVAVIDTGVRPHADLASQLLSGWDFVSNSTMGHDGDGRDNDASDPGDGCTSGRSSWHGTHVAGTIAAVTGNATGGAGVAPGARIVPVRALGCGGGYSSDIADAIAWSAGVSVSGATDNAHPARVLNLSLGGQGSCGVTTQNAINAARAKGAVVVVAAGNSNADVAKFNPANCKGVITVAATGPTGKRAPYSNKGTAVDVAAPGGDMSLGSSAGVLSTLNDGAVDPGNDTYAYYQGTSMATPHVAGVVALMLARDPGLAPDDVEALLKSTVRAFPATCTGCGKGIVDAGKAVTAVRLGTSQAGDVAEVESNSKIATAQLLATLPARVAGTIASKADLDHYRLSIAAGARITARLLPNSASNYDLSLRTTSGAVKASSSKAAGLADTITWQNKGASAVTMILRVAHVSGSTGAAGTYSLEVAAE